MTIDELLTTLRAERDDLLGQAEAAMRQSQRHGANAELLSARIQGVEEGRELTLATAQVADGESPATQAERIVERVARERRNIRGLVYAAIAEAKIGMTEADLVKKLGAAKASVASALSYHAANGDAWCSETGIWAAHPGGTGARDKVTEPDTHSPVAAAQSNGDDSGTLDEPPSVVDVIRGAGEDGITDEELAKQGYPFVAVVRAEKAGAVTKRNGRIYAVNAR